eukprot:m.65255 g.65255  ORF g.65255 m.65255 type:complete len:711 (+) comp35310_c0_seq11:2486-4618(+)
MLNERISSLEEESESEGKILKMAQLQCETERNQATREKIAEQIKSWEMNTEGLYMDIFRLKCYVASLQRTESPNSQSVLGRVSKSTKVALGRLQRGFTVSSLHAVVSARRCGNTSNVGRTPSDLLYVKQSYSPKLGRSPKPKMRIGKHIKSGLRHLVAGGKDQNKNDGEKARRPSIDVKDASELEVVELRPGQRIWDALRQQTVRVKLPHKQFIEIPLEDLTSFGVLRYVYQKMHLDPEEHFVVLHRHTEDGLKESFVPEEDFPLQSMDFEEVEVAVKVRLDVHMTQTPDTSLGFGVEFESPSEGLTTYGCLVISHVDPGGLAESHGLFEGDEILSVNGTSVDELGITEALAIIEEACFGMSISGLLSLSVRSRRLETPVFQKAMDSMINHLILPPPMESQEQELTEEDVRGLIVPPPSLEFGKELTTETASPSIPSPTIVPSVGFSVAAVADLDPFSSLTIDSLQAILHNVDELTKYVRSLHEYGDDTGPQTSRQLTPEEKLQKCVAELVETERTYVKQLNVLLNRYMRPLRSESFLKRDEINSLFGNLEEIVPFQGEFLEALEEAARLGSKNESGIRVRTGSRQGLPDLIAIVMVFHAEHDFLGGWSFSVSRRRFQTIQHVLRESNSRRRGLAARSHKSLAEGIFGGEKSEEGAHGHSSLVSHPTHTENVTVSFVFEILAQVNSKRQRRTCSTSRRHCKSGRSCRFHQ